MSFDKADLSDQHCRNCAEELIDNESIDGLCEDCHGEEACPGCGYLPGQGINPECNDEGGCGFWRSEGEVNQVVMIGLNLSTDFVVSMSTLKDLQKEHGEIIPTDEVMKLFRDYVETAGHENIEYTVDDWIVDESLTEYQDRVVERFVKKAVDPRDARIAELEREVMELRQNIRAIIG